MKVYLVADPDGARPPPAGRAARDRRRRARHRPQAARRVRPGADAAGRRRRDRSTRPSSGSTRSSRGSRSSSASAWPSSRWPTATSPGGRSRLWLAPLTRVLTPRRAPTGSSACPPSGGCVLAINHLAWIDIPLVGALSPRNINYVAKVELASRARLRRATSTGTGSSPSAAASPTATRCGGCAAPPRDGPRDRRLRRGDAAAQRAARARPSRAPRWSRSRSRCRSSRSPSTARSSGSPATSRRARSRSASRSASRASPEGGEGYKEASAEIERRINVLFDWLAERARPRPAARGDARRCERARRRRRAGEPPSSTT